MSLQDRIIDEATKLFAHQGIKAVRMDDIASSMGISKRTIYEVFGDKENLILECLNYFNDKMNEMNAEITAGASNIIEEYLLIMEVWDKQMDASHNIVGNIKKFYPRIYDKYSKTHMKEAYSKLKIKLKQGVEQGYLLDNVNLNLAISVFGHSIYGILKNDATMPHNVSEREAFKYITTYFFRGIATPKGIAMIDEYFKNKN